MNYGFGASIIEAWCSSGELICDDEEFVFVAKFDCPAPLLQWKCRRVETDVESLPFTIEEWVSIDVFASRVSCGV